MRIILLICSFMLGLSSCEEPIGVTRVYRITVFNDTERPVRYLVGTKYPDTSIPDEPSRLVPAKGKATLDSKDPWEEETNSGVISFFFFNPDTISAYAWETVRNEYRIIHRRDIKIADLETSDYRVHFP